MKNKVLLLIFVFLLMVTVVIGAFIFFYKTPNLPLDISSVEKYPNIGYRHLGYYKGVKYPIHLNFENQEERFEAVDEFCNYVLATSDSGDTFCNLGSIIAYKIDLNDDGFDEIIGFVKQSNLAKQRTGYKLEILIPSEIYKMQNPDVKEFDEDVLGWQRISYHTNVFSEPSFGVYVMPQKTNGFHDLNLYLRNGDLIARYVERYDERCKRYGFGRVLSNKAYLRFNNARSPYYKYELDGDKYEDEGI